MVIGANPTDAHPVFASRMKKRLRRAPSSSSSIRAASTSCASPHVEAAYHLPLLPGTNVAIFNAIAHVVVTEGLVDEDFVRERCDRDAFRDWAEFVARPQNSPEAVAKISGVPAETPRRRPALRYRRQCRDLLRARRHRAQPRHDRGDGDGQSRDGDRQYRPRGVGVNPLRGQNNVQGACDMGSFPHELSGTDTCRTRRSRAVRKRVGREPRSEPGLRIPNMLDAAVDGSFIGIYVQGEDILQSDPDTHHVAAGLAAMECVVVQDLFLNETASYAHVFLPARPSSKRTALSSMPSAASIGCAR